MRIFIITMDDPIQTYRFIQYIIDHKKDQIVGLAVTEGDRLRIGKKRSKLTYLCSLLLIMGVRHFALNSIRTLWFKARRKAHSVGLSANPSIGAYAEAQGIPVWWIKTPNGKAFQQELKKLDIDVVINQSQSIIKKGLLDIPKIGVINRHNALLPKNRGRLTPFWVLYKGEKESGVSIHFVTEGIDAGAIIVQKNFPISPRESFNSLVRRNYELAPKAMVEALDKLEANDTNFIPNKDEEATYNTVPTFREAWRFRLQAIKNRLAGRTGESRLQESTHRT